MFGLFMTDPSTKVSRWLRLANWLDESPIKKVLAAAAGVVALALSVLNGGWSAWKEYRALKQVPVIHIASRTSYSLSAPVSVERILGAMHSSTKEAPPIPMPYFPVVLELSNPTSQRTSLSHCSLTLKFYQRLGAFSSDGYMTAQGLRANPPESRPVLPIESGETKQVEVLFFFLPAPELGALLKDKSTQPFRFQVTCHNEAGGAIESRVM